MIHHMKLNPQPFEMIKAGDKTIELRLNDEKRQQIKIGDRITFSNTLEPALTIHAEVLKLHFFPGFHELYESLPLEKCGYLPEETAAASADDMLAYYTIEQQNRFGVVGIEIQVIATDKQ